MRRKDFWPAVLRAMIGCKTGAKSRGLEFDLTLEQYYEIANNNCYFCDKEKTLKRPPKKWQEPVYLSGLDRMNNLLGYSVENCVPCCDDCNGAKSDMSVDQFKEWCLRVEKKKWWE